jgi:hypothetical protein
MGEAGGGGEVAGPTDLILRSLRSRRLEGWTRTSWFETAQERLLTMRNAIRAHG